jgi:hypothetical protein
MAKSQLSLLAASSLQSAWSRVSEQGPGKQVMNLPAYCNNPTLPRISGIAQDAR